MVGVCQRAAALRATGQAGGMAEECGHGHGTVQWPSDDEGPAGWDRFAAEVIRGHSTSWIAHAGVVQFGNTNLVLRVHVDGVKVVGDTTTATLLFNFGGPAIGEPLFASFSGYGNNALAAVLEGACLWSQDFIPPLLAGYGGVAGLDSITDRPDIGRFESHSAEISGHLYDVAFGSLGRVLSTVAGGVNLQSEIDATRARLRASATSMGEVVMRHASFPKPALNRPTLLSTFVGDVGGQRTTEVKIDGVDWPEAHVVFADRPPGPTGLVVLLRELAVLVPRDPSMSVAPWQRPIPAVDAVMNPPLPGRRRFFRRN